jgi:hypothetical protein
MKKLILIICVILFLAIAGIYVLIPSTITVGRVVPAKCRVAAAFPFFRDSVKWASWWPGGRAGESDGFRYQLGKLYYNAVDVDIRGEEQTIGSRISLIPIGSLDSMLINWDCQLNAGANPIRRVRQYLFGKRLGRSLETILDSAGAFLSSKTNVYGIVVHEGSTTDSCLAATRVHFDAYPSTADIYQVIHRVQNYIKAEGRTQTGYPMMNVIKEEGEGWRLMVAVPSSGAVREKGDIYVMRLIPGKYLISDVQGGEHAVRQALASTKRFIDDYQRTVMAVPFESLITDRSQEPDTAQWKTRIYYPIF